MSNLFLKFCPASCGAKFKEKIMKQMQNNLDNTERINGKKTLANRLEMLRYRFQRYREMRNGTKCQDILSQIRLAEA